jgi:hypothetical protein
MLLDQNKNISETIDPISSSMEPEQEDQNKNISETIDPISSSMEPEQEAKNITFELEASDIVERHNRTLKRQIIQI